MRGWGLAVAVGAVLLAGCVSGPQGCVPPRSAQDVPALAPGEAGFGADAVTIEVVDDRDAAVPGANVTVVWNRDYIEPPDDEDDEVPEAPVLEYVDLRTDAAGQALAWLPAGRFFMAAATAPGYTEEWTVLHWPGVSPLDVTLALHPSRVAVAGSGALAAGAGHGAQEAQWDPVHLAWPAPVRTPGATDTFAGRPFEWLDERMLRLDAWMAWTTGTGEVAQLALGVGRTTTDEDAGAAEPPGALGPEHNLTASIEPDIEWYGPDVSFADGVWVGPRRQGAFVSLDGVPFEVGAVAHLDHRAVATAECGVVFPGSEQRPAAPGAEERPQRESDLAVPSLAWGWLVCALGLLVASRRG